MKNIIIMVMLIGLATPSLSAAEKKEKWFGVGVKPDPNITIPFLGVKAPLPTVCAGKDVSAYLSNFLTLSSIGNFPAFL